MFKKSKIKNKNEIGLRLKKTVPKNHDLKTDT